MDNYEQFFAEHLRKQAHSYYSDLMENVEITLKSTDLRLSANLYHYTIADEHKTYPVIIKLRHGYQDPKYISTHPRRYIVDPNSTFELEHQALSEIYNLFHELDDERFGAIRVLDVLSEHNAIIMSESFAPDLRYFFLRHNRIQALSQHKDLLPIFHNVGAWLKYFHSLPTNATTELCHYTRGSFIQSVEQFTDYLAKTIGYKSYFERLMLGVSQYANVILADELPLGRTHGDYAMRNILLEKEQQIVVIDTIAKWQTAIYEDIGYFIVRLWSNQIQVFSLGLAYSHDWIKACERAFLEGYFGKEAIPEDLIVLYKILSLLDQWSATSASLTLKSSVKNKIRLGLMNRYFLTLLDTWMAQKTKTLSQVESNE